MSWTDELYKIYENNCNRDDFEVKMLPMSHSTTNAQIELSITEHGDFCTASRIDKSDSETIIPVTEDSIARSSGIFPHPFADKMIYIAGDYKEYSKNPNAKCEEYFDAYMKQLKDWADSDCSHAAVRAVFNYLQKRTIIKDLITCGVLTLDEDTGKLSEKDKIDNIAQDACFVRFRVFYDDITRETKTWADKTLYDSFIAFNSKNLSDAQLCYATGRILPATYKHPSKIRNAGDKGRLISCNDDSGFTYRGRFKDKYQAISVSYDFSQKMHNALKWLIARQGEYINGMTLLVWESALLDTPLPTDSASQMMGLDFDDDKSSVPDTYPMFKNMLHTSIQGRKSLLKPLSKTMVMGLDAATTGRVSIVMYSELQSSEFLDNLESWHNDASWLRYNSKLKKKTVNSFSLAEIINCAFGTEQGNFLKASPEYIKDYMCRLIPCVTEKRKIPKDLISALANKASAPLAYDNTYNWRNVLEAACGMIRKSLIEKGVECEMALDKNKTDRDYLYGRLLAIAEKAEYDAYDSEDKGRRIPNARRYMTRFSSHPYQTWKVIYERLLPYLNKLNGSYYIFYTRLIQEIMSKFDYNEFQNDKKLDTLFLLGYDCQMNDLYTSNKKQEE